jgi:anti-sigma B factor antagonist
MVLAVTGELDIATADQVRSAVHDLRRAGATSILIDLRALEFTDSQGPHVMIDLQDESHAGGGRIAVVPGRATVQRVFDLTRTSPRLRWVGAA